MNKRQRKKNIDKVFDRLIKSMKQGEDIAKELYLEDAELMDEIAKMEQNDEQQD